MPGGRDHEFGEWLVSQGVLGPAQLQATVDDQRSSGKSLAEALLDLRLVDKEGLMRAVSSFSGLPVMRLNLEAVDPEVVKLVPAHLYQKHRAVPVGREEGLLVIAVAFPLDGAALEELTFACGHELKQVLVDEMDVAEAIERFSRGDVLEQKIGEWDKESLVFIDRNREVETDSIEVDELDTVKLVNLLLVKAIKERASDIHVEPGEASTLVRFRVDGVLREETRFDPVAHPAIISRIKVLSNLDIAERRLPQDGSFFAEYEEKDVDFRVSTSPTIYGESASIRLLDQGKATVQLQELGYEPDDLEKLYKALDEPYVFVLSTVQRLVRKLCPKCREAYAPDQRELAELGLEPEGLTLFRARGCEACGESGYHGRVGVYEVMPMTEDLKEMMTTQVPISKVKETAVRQGMKTLWRNASVKVAAGVTSTEEIKRHIARDEG